MTSEVSICNSALLKIGAERITSLSENSKRAIICNEQYAKNRDTVLRAHPWNFAIARATLAALVQAPEFEYLYQYPLPADCLRVLNCQDPAIEFKIEGGYLLTDEDTIQIRYIKQITDPTKFDACFTEALACRLASDLAYAIAQNATLSQTMDGAYRAQLKEARTMDAQEGTPETPDANEWLYARF